MLFNGWLFYSSVLQGRVFFISVLAWVGSLTCWICWKTNHSDFLWSWKYWRTNHSKHTYPIQGTGCWPQVTPDTDQNIYLTWRLSKADWPWWPNRNFIIGGRSKFCDRFSCDQCTMHNTQYTRNYPWNSFRFRPWIDLIWQISARKARQNEAFFGARAFFEVIPVQFWGPCIDFFYKNMCFEVQK